MTTSALHGDNGSRALVLRTVQREDSPHAYEEFLERHWWFISEDSFQEEITFHLGPNGLDFRWRNTFSRIST